MTSKDKKEELHVLLVAFSAQSHINPLLRLGKSLLTKGLHVTLATNEIVYHTVFKSSSTTPNNTNTPISVTTNGIDVLFFSDGFVNNEDLKGPDEYMELIAKFGPPNLSNLIKDHFFGTSKKLACIINNPFVPWVADVAVEFKIPCACLWIQPCALYAIYYHFYNNFKQFPNLDEDPDLSVQLPGLPLLKKQDLPSFILPSNPFGSLSKVLAEMFQDMKKKLKWVLANSFNELENEVIDSMAKIFPITTVGPLVPPSLLGQDQHEDIGIEMLKPEDSCMEWLNHQPPSSVIYISFGSLIVLSAKQMESIAKALKNTNHHFLWVIKHPNEAEPLQGFLEETKDRGLVVPWCPQTKVLVHPAIACFLTHCGWNSMLEAITAGIPMIAYPQWTDQPTNAKLISDVFCMGIRLKQDNDGFVSCDEVERAIEEIVRGPSSKLLKKNALELKRAARDAVDDGGSSERNIQSFVDEILNTTLDNK